MSEGALPAFAGYGIEIEYMLVHSDTLDIAPIADRVLEREAGVPAADIHRGAAGWSNELALHVLEIKNREPQPQLEFLSALFRGEVARVNHLLAPMGARLMPGGMHPWMEPRRQTCLWPHEGSEIYARFDRLFDCRRHGWANLQAVHLNLPFADDRQFAALHAAVRLVLPVLPALAASSPFIEGRASGVLDTRLDVYRTNCARLPSITGQVIPESVSGRAQYEAQILQPIYRDLARVDDDSMLRREWVNARGAIARFERNAIEIRLPDTQECPRADLAIAAATVFALRGLYEEGLSEPLRESDTQQLAAILSACVSRAEQAQIEDRAYLAALGFPGRSCRAAELWQHMLERPGGPLTHPLWRDPLQLILHEGSLARRLLRAAGEPPRPGSLRECYAQLCLCLEQDRLFSA